MTGTYWPMRPKRFKRTIPPTEIYGERISGVGRYKHDSTRLWHRYDVTLGAWVVEVGNRPLMKDGKIATFNFSKSLTREEIHEKIKGMLLDGKFGTDTRYGDRKKTPVNLTIHLK